MTLVLCVLLAGYKACVFVAAQLPAARKDVVAATFWVLENARLRFAAHQGALRRITDLVWFCTVLVYHPLRTFVGSALVPKLRAFAEQGEEGESTVPVVPA